MSINRGLFVLTFLVIGSLTVACTSTGDMKSGGALKFGAPTEGMSTKEYQSLVFLDPQNTVRMDWAAVKGMDGNFLIDNQGEPTVSVVDYNKGETVKMIQMGETGNHHPLDHTWGSLCMVIATL